MSHRIDGNKIFIDIQGHEDKLGLEIYSEKSHKLREFLRKFMDIFCRCFSTTHEYQNNGQTCKYSYFNFETFNLNFGPKVYYVKKADYEKWKQNNQYPTYDTRFSYDFMSLIEPK